MKQPELAFLAIKQPTRWACRWRGRLEPHMSPYLLRSYHLARVSFLLSSSMRCVAAAPVSFRMP
jgi:hypothetical protein